jgi:hypothetical protein
MLPLALPPEPQKRADEPNQFSLLRVYSVLLQ